MHGIRETKTLFFAYLSRLYRDSGLRDVIIEEDQVYEKQAQAFVQGSRNDLPQELCLHCKWELRSFVASCQNWRLIDAQCYACAPGVFCTSRGTPAKENRAAFGSTWQ
jgi:hypothetical protein